MTSQDAISSVDPGAVGGGDSPQLQAAFAELGRIVLGSQPLGQVLQRVADLAAQCLSAQTVSVTLVEGERARSAAFSGPVAAALDERQYEVGFGPCMDAAVSGETVAVPDTAAEETYPDFAAAARRLGVRSSVSVGMPIPQRVVGALNIYTSDGEPMGPEEVAAAQAFASFAAVALANAALYSSTAELAGQMQQAMTSRAVIDQAKGVLVLQLGCSPDEAFEHLAKLSQDTNRKLRDLAADVVTRAQHGQL